MTNKTFILAFLTLLLSLMASVFLINYMIDPYGKNSSFEFELNKIKAVRDERIEKYQLIQEAPNATSFIFGSSKALLLDPVLLGKLTKTEALNIAFGSASVDEYYLYIKYLTETRKVSNIVIGIDFFAYTKYFNSNGTLPQDLLNYFSLDDDYSLSNYFSYKMLKSSIKTIRYNKANIERVSVSDKYTDKGQVIAKEYLKAKKDKTSFDNYIKKHVIDTPPHWGSRFSELSQKQLEYLEEIRKICSDKKINLYIFMTPLYIGQITMKQNRFNEQLELLDYLTRNIGPVLDFNSITRINTDPYAYLDVFHYSYDVADAILPQLINGDIVNEKYRGQLVSAENVDEYIKHVKSRLDNYMQVGK